tara:strand:- start:29269 stop:29919 length:651 start_codon:yes stop_codon:yes gene_type:complete
MTSYTQDRQRLRSAGVIPVLTIDDASKAVPLAKALVAGGLDAIEITLRTPCAAEAISEIVNSDVDCMVGVGTVLTAADVETATKTGAQFLVTPATPPGLVAPLSEFDGLVVPGISTPGEALTLFESGFDLLKFFPAEACGGANMMKSLASPLPALTFMPTGGIGPDMLASYLSLPNVIAVGGSWLVKADDLKNDNWETIEARARQASAAVKEIRPD